MVLDWLWQLMRSKIIQWLASFLIMVAKPDAYTGGWGSMSIAPLSFPVGVAAFPPGKMPLARSEKFKNIGRPLTDKKAC